MDVQVSCGAGASTAGGRGSRPSRGGSWVLGLGLWVLGLGAWPAVAWAGSVEGYVFAAGTGAPLAEVEIRIAAQPVPGPSLSVAAQPVPGTILSVRTDASGGFVAELDGGVYDITVGNSTFAQVVVGREGVTELLVTLEADGSASAQIEAPDAAVLEGVELQDAPTGTVSGVLTDEEEGGPVAGARIFVKGFDADARTDAEGRFALELPAGSWELSVIRSGYATRNLRVESVAGESRELALDMVPTSVQLAVFTVTAPAIEGNTASLLAERQDSSQVADIIGAEQMSKTGDSTAAAALRRVTGLTLIDGKYVYVRGLGERYSATLVNGANLPSPEPERRVVPLDMFPASILDAIVVQKTFSPDMPAEFGGGVVQIRTRTAPERPFLQVGLSGGWVSDTTFRPTLGYQGGPTDWLGVDGGTRALPEVVQQASDGSPLEEGDMFSDRGYAPDKLEELGEAMPNRWNLSEGRAAPNGGLSMQGGGSVDTGFGRLGVLAAMLYDREVENDNREELFYVVEGGEEVPSHRYDFAQTTETVRLGGLFTTSLEVGEDHRVSFVSVLNRITDDEARRYEGENRDVGAAIRIGRLRWLERQLMTQQLLGEHTLGAQGVELGYRYTYSTAGRLEPDRREYRFDNEPGTDVWRMSDRPEGNQRFFSVLSDRVHDMGLDLTVPIALGEERELRLSAGGLAMFKARSVDSRRFKYMHKGPLSRDQDTLALDMESILAPENIGADGFQFEEITRQTDNYSAAQTLVAGYAMADMDLTRSTRVLGGVRLEKSRQSVSTFELFNPDAVPVDAVIDTTDLLPAATVTQQLGLEGMQLRAGYGRTLNRPDFREMSPATFNDVTGGRLQRGNPELERALIDNLDLRWELYPNPGESVSVGLFYKRFHAPIETVVIPSAQLSVEPRNAERAVNYGVELDGRKDLAFLGGAGEDFFVAGNLALIDSRITLPDDPEVVLTNSVRPLQGQSPWVVNVSAGWDDLDGKGSAVVSLNDFGKRIVEVGAFPADDTYALHRMQLDFTGRYALGGGFALTAKAKNLVPRPQRVRVGELMLVDNPTPVELSLGVRWQAQARE